MVKELLVDQPGPLWDFLSDPCYYGAARTGSRRWEVHTSESDHDYFIASDLFHKQCPGVLRTSGEFADGCYNGEDREFYSIKFRFQGNLINIIHAEQSEIYCWQFANNMTDTVVREYGNSLIAAKSDRVTFFDQCKKLFRSQKVNS